jgi:hypothetical protein
LIQGRAGVSAASCSATPLALQLATGGLIGATGAMAILTAFGVGPGLIGWAWIGWTAAGLLITVAAVRRWGRWLMGPFALVAVAGPFLSLVSGIISIAWLARLMLALAFGPKDVAALGIAAYAIAATGLALFSLAASAREPYGWALRSLVEIALAVLLVAACGVVLVGARRLLLGGTSRLLGVGVIAWVCASAPESAPLLAVVLVIWLNWTGTPRTPETA